MKKIVLLPTYNEKENVKIIIPEIFENLPDTQIMVIDDNSPDGTANVIKEMQMANSNLLLLNRKEKKGLGEAYKDAINKVISENLADVVFTMDADGSHKATYLKDFINNIDNHDLLIGSRYITGGETENWEFWRKKLSSWGNIYSRTLTGIPVNDLTAGFICARTELLKKINLDNISSAGYAYQIEFKYHCHKKGAKIKEIPINFGSRREGESKMSKQIITEGIKTPLQIFIKRLWKKQ